MSNWVLVLISVILALVPALIWLYIFNKQNPETKKTLFITFLAGMFSTVIILFYKNYLWGKAVNFIFFELHGLNFKLNIANLFDYESIHLVEIAAKEGVQMAILAVFFMFVGVGAMEEYIKHWVVKVFDKPFFRSIDDVIELSIVAALGFSFVEDILYFINYWHDMTTMQFAVFAFFRVTVVTMVHVLCSGIFGYFYGVAVFAGPVLKDEMRDGRKHFLLRWFHKVFRFKTKNIFRDEKIMEGLFLSIMLHAVYDFVVSLSFTFTDLFKLIGLNIKFDLGIHVFIMPLYLVGGYFLLLYLLNKKEDHKKYGKLVLREEYIQEA